MAGILGGTLLIKDAGSELSDVKDELLQPLC